jgi:hypothetical protein
LSLYHRRVSGRAFISRGPRNKKQWSNHDGSATSYFEQFMNNGDFTTMADLEPVARDKREYLLAELRAAALRA